jgi:hypothetical protein
VTNRTLLALAAVLLLAAPGSARAGDQDPFREDGSIRYRFYTEWELLYVERDRSPDVEVGYFNADGSLAGVPSREVLSTDEVVDDDEHFGGRALFGVRLNERSSVEIAFAGWGHSRSATERDPGENLDAFEFPEFPLDDGEFNDAAVFDLDYDSDFYSGELNYRHALAVDEADYRFTLLAGVRALRLEEDLDFTSWDEIPFDPTSFGTYNIATRNTLIGGQVGIETHVPLWEERVVFDLYGVAGGYANLANVYINYADVDSDPLLFRQSRKEWDPAGVFEGAAHFTFRIWRGVRVRAGYRVIYLVNIAAAPDQFPRTGATSDVFGNTFDNDGATVFHGPSLAVNVDF